jgi:hypothetical protein
MLQLSQRNRVVPKSTAKLSRADAISAAAAEPLRRASTSTIRLCNLRDPRPDVDPLRLSAAQKLVLYRSLGYPSRPSDSDLISAHIDFVFNRDASLRRDRYSNSVNALYTSMDRTTAESEMRYHSRVNFFNPSYPKMSFSFAVVKVNFNGRLRDIRQICTKTPGLLSKRKKDLCQLVGASAMPGADAILVRSVRFNGDNQVTYVRGTVSPGRVLGTAVIDVFVRATGRHTRIR